MSFHDEVENRLDEIVDSLRKPAGEFVPRVRSILIAFMSAIVRRLHALEDDEPTNPRTPARKRQETMEIDVSELQEITEQERRRLR